MVRRKKTEIVDWRGTPRLPCRKLMPIEVAYPPEETAARATLSRYAELRKAAAADRTETFATDFVLKLLKKRLFSTPEASRLTLEKHRKSVGAGASVGMAQLRRQIEDPSMRSSPMTRPMTAPKAMFWRRRAARPERCPRTS